MDESKFISVSDAVKFLKSAEKAMREVNSGYNVEDEIAGMEAAVSWFLKLPAADVRPVVFCKNCIHYEMGACLKIYDDGTAAKEAWHKRKPDDFCSYGAKMEAQDG